MLIAGLLVLATLSAA
uniref:Uncharacterized protein n=1 Tax=Arundo donax TaxID=35708 RepID=A0A0A8YRI9_ARUDO